MTFALHQLFIPHTSKDADGSWNVYLSRVDFSQCGIIADVNVDSTLNVADVTAFLDWYGNTDLRSDLNHDGVIDAQDFLLFTTSYGCACNP